MNKLIINTKEPLKYMEGLVPNSFKMIFLEPPFNTGNDDFIFKNGTDDNDKKYGEYIGRLVERAFYLLKNDGFLCFSIISSMNSNYNYQMILEHFFKKILVITLMYKKRIPTSKGLSSHALIYCCSKDEGYDFPDLREIDDQSNYPELDENGRYFRKIPAYRYLPVERENFKYEWNGIKPKGNMSWAFTKERMDEEYKKGNIIIEGMHVYRKKYQDESFVPVPSVWENDNFRSAISEKNMLRLINLFSKEGEEVFCPFERDGMFSWCADKSNRIWTSVYTPFGNRKNYIDLIPETSYEKDTPDNESQNIQYEDITKSANEVNELNDKLNHLQESVRTIQKEIGIDENDEDKIDAVIDKIHEKITSTLSEQNISGYVPEAQNWVTPYWDRLENESKQFLPTGAFLFKQFETQPDADYAPAMIEYCRTLEKEIFEKLFRGYIQNLIDRNVNPRNEFSDSFSNNDSRVFAEFIEECVTKNPGEPEKWHFELGKMAYVLTRVLARRQRVFIYGDFRTFLNNAFDSQFFGTHFSDQLSYISKLRNACAHPSVVNQGTVTEGRELIRQKLNSILAYYN